MGVEPDRAELYARIARLEDERARLLQQQTALKYVVASIPYFVFWKDREGRYLGCNDAFAKTAGFDDPAAIIGKTDFDMPWTREESEFYRDVDRKVMAGKTPLLDIEESQLVADGRSSTILTSKVPLLDAAGDAVGILGIYADISARKQLELDLQAAKEAAEAASQAKTDFLATVSHELRTPLALVLGPLDLLYERTDLPEDAKKSLANIRRNGWRLKNLVDDVLDFAKTDAKMVVVSREATDVAALVRAIVEEARPAAEARSIELLCEVESIPLVSLDRRMVERILLNFIGNALKFTASGGHVAVSACLDGDDIVLAVRDDGIGVSEENRERLFRRFQQADASTTRRYGGTGLGLAIVKEYAELMGGRAGVESALGRGSSFFVALPRVEANDDVVSPLLAHDRAGLEARFETERTTAVPSVVDETDERPLVILAEDSAALRAHVTEVLASYRVVSFANGRDALAAARHHCPDVIVTDVMMPEMDGNELLACVKSDPTLRDIPVIVLTAFAERSRVSSTLDAGADDFLEKPFTPAELKSRVGVACRLHASRKELVSINAQLLATLDRAVETEKLAALGRMLSQVAHELNNPMCAVLGNIEPLTEYVDSMTKMLGAYDAAPGLAGDAGADLRVRRTELDIDYAVSDIRECISCVREGVDRVRALQSDLRSFLRGGSGNAGNKVCDLNEDLRTTVDMLRRGLPPDVALRADYGALPALAVNAGQLKQVLLNLLQNAIDAVGNSGTIEVATACTNDVVTIKVSDSGPGIQPGLRTKIFEPFFTTKDVGKGSGLGLAICRQILQAHGGGIRLEDQPKGAQFVIELPAKRSA